MQKLILKKIENNPQSLENNLVTQTNINLENPHNSLLVGLNQSQQEAVETTEGAVLVVAGAGSGKTRVLTFRIAHILQKGVPAYQILALTFTNKAAAEMKERICKLVGEDVGKNLWMGTFHSVFGKILRMEAEKIGYTSSFSIYDSDDQTSVIKQIMASQGISTQDFSPKMIRSRISSAKNAMVTPQEYSKYARDFVEEKIALVYTDYEKKLRANNAMDFDDLLIRIIELFSKCPEVLEKYQNKFRYIVIDEYQDTNKAQYTVVNMLAKKWRNICVVGDDAQSIYSFRGANFTNIFEFPEMFPETKIIKLEENYRSTQPILDCTNEIIRIANVRYEKNLYTRKVGGALPLLVSVENEQTQSQLICQQILELREQGLELNDIAVLFRSGYHSFDLEVELNKTNIPFIKYGGFKFIETAHIKDIIAYLRIITNPKDIVSWNRALLLIGGVGPRTAQKIISALEHDVIRLDESYIPEVIKLTNENVALLFDMLCAAKHGSIVLSEKIKIITDYYLPIMQSKYDDFHKRTKDIAMFEDITSRYKSLNSLLSDMALDPPTQSVEDINDKPDDEKLILSTIHSAKGLEWNAVFIIWTLDGFFPTFHSANNLESMEEERRLMYVAATRAKEVLYFIYPINIYERETGTVLSKVSRFIDGIPEDILEKYAVETGE